MRTLVMQDGTKIQIPDRLKELSEVRVTSPSGKKYKTSWGSVVAQTNGEILKLL